MAQAERAGLPKVGSRRELVRVLEEMNTPARRRAAAPRAGGPGKADRVKTYILESGRLLARNRGSRVSWEISDGGFSHVKLLHVRINGSPGYRYKFFLDKEDSRFLSLHTNENGKMANFVIRCLVSELDYSFDHAWFYSDLLQKWAKDKSGESGRYVIEHHNKFQKEPLRLRIEGRNAQAIYNKLIEMEEVAGCASQRRAELRGGGKYPRGKYVRDEVVNTGCFTIQKGNSIRDHLELVNECKEEYRGIVSRVEENRLGVRIANGSKELTGKPFVIRFPGKIPDLERFIDGVFDSQEPFRLWGTRMKADEGQYSVAGVDMHEGGTINFDVSESMMRVYLHDGCCGNTLVRLFTNLQLHYDSRVRCRELEA